MELVNHAKKYIIPIVILIVSLYFPISFLIGIIIGYFCTALYHKKFIETGKVSLLIFNIGRYEIHLHHWVTGILLFLVIYLSGVLFQLPFFWIGAIAGVILHDLYTDDIWYKIISKIDEN